MSSPSQASVFEAIDATWAPSSMRRMGDWILREGASGGNRVSATSFHGSDETAAVIPLAETAMKSAGNAPLFMIRPGQNILDQRLAEREYEEFAAVNIYVGHADLVASRTANELLAIPCHAPLAVQKEIWEEGGIGATRLDVMARVKVPKTHMLARKGDRPIGTAFVAVDREIGMLHALEVRKSARKQGVGEMLTRAAASWCAAHGARYFAILVTRENTGGNALYTRVGMTKTAHYHYRRKTE